MTMGFVGQFIYLLINVIQSDKRCFVKNNNITCCPFSVKIWFVITLMFPTNYYSHSWMLCDHKYTIRKQIITSQLIYF